MKRLRASGVLGVTGARRVWLLTEQHPYGRLAWRAKGPLSPGVEVRMSFNEFYKREVDVLIRDIRNHKNDALFQDGQGKDGQVLVVSGGLDGPLRLRTRAAPARDGIDRA